MVPYLSVTISLTNNKLPEATLASFCETVSSYKYTPHSQSLLYVAVLGQGLTYMHFNFVGSLSKMKVEF